MSTTPSTPTPDLKSLLLDELVKALLEKLLEHLNPGPKPPDPPVTPPVQPPVPPVVPTPSPKPPVIAGSPVATGLSLEIAEMYSPWFKVSADSDDERATPEQRAKILEGINPLPPNTLLYLGIEPTPAHLDLFGDPVIPTKLTWHYKVEGPGLQGEVEFTPLDGHSGPYESELGKVKPGRFDPSNGYTGILVTNAPGGGGPSKGALWATGKLPDGSPLTSNVVQIPWMAGH